jgi:hypothetical protein
MEQNMIETDTGTHKEDMKGLTRIKSVECKKNGNISSSITQKLLKE